MEVTNKGDVSCREQAPRHAQSGGEPVAWIVQLTKTIKSVPFAYPLRSHEKDESGTARPGVFISGETRSSSGALSSPGGPGWPPGPLSHSSRRIFDHARVLFGTGLGRPRRCLPPRSRIGPRRRRQQRGEGARGGRERALRGDSRGLGTCPEPQDPSSRHHSPTSYEDHRI